MAAAERLLEVVAAVMQRPDGSFLLTERPAGKVYAGHWEFPGGKVEAGESLSAALARELAEELGVRVVNCYPWIVRVFKYPHATVRLHFYRVTAWENEPHPHEGQRFAWCRADAVEVSPVLPANGPVFRALSLPPVYGITQATPLGVEPFLARLDMALERGLRLVQIRENSMNPVALEKFAREVVQRCGVVGARVLVNRNTDLARRVGAHGVHLPAALLESGGRPDVEWVGASCHDVVELEQAIEAGADFAVLSPVLPTASHPGEPALGWAAFTSLAAASPIPVYALGGMTPSQLEIAWRHGGHGIAMLRRAWQA